MNFNDLSSSLSEDDFKKKRSTVVVKAEPKIEKNKLFRSKEVKKDNPIKDKEMIGNQLWRKFKNKIFETD